MRYEQGRLKSPIGRLLQRHAEQAIRGGSADTRVVLSTGARRAGRAHCCDRSPALTPRNGGTWDVPVIRQAALADPAGFVDYPDMMVIDEIQRVPELLLPIKVRWIMTGVPAATCSAAPRGYSPAWPSGHAPRRMETIELWPFSQGEIDEAPDGFIDAIFAHGRISGMHPRSAGPSTPTGSYAAASPRRLPGPARAAGSGSMTLTSPTWSPAMSCSSPISSAPCR